MQHDFTYTQKKYNDETSQNCSEKIPNFCLGVLCLLKSTPN